MQQQIKLILKLKLPVIFLLIFILSSNVKAQNVIQLTHVKSDRKLKLITEGMRVRYSLKPAQAGEVSVPVTGIINEITPTTVAIDGLTIAIEDFKGFGRKKKGSNFWGWFLTSLGNRIWISALISAAEDDTPRCSNCNVYVKEDASSKAGPYVFTGLGLGIAYLGINKLIRNSKRDVVNKWKMEIVEAK